jgi:glycosyltransferase involved in cell wall biosynthesis
MRTANRAAGTRCQAEPSGFSDPPDVVWAVRVQKKEEGYLMPVAGAMRIPPDVAESRGSIVSVIVPAYEAANELRACLAAVRDSTVQPHEVIVVDDGSTDGTCDVAREGGAICVSVPEGPRGPAAARNTGARIATGNVLMFIDADVAVHPDALERMVEYLESDPSVSAVFGSYDDRPWHTAAVSKYRNLLHHFVHQHGRRNATTFWAGLGAIRREAFSAARGFDETFLQASIEDIELGTRLHGAGYRLWLCPDIQGRHMKRWTFTDVLRTDVLHRAIPWTRLILSQGRIPNDLNTSRSSQISALLAWTIVLVAAAALLAPRLLWIALAAALAHIVLNAGLYAFFARRGGLRFMLAAIGMHALYLLYSSAVFAGLSAGRLLRRLTGGFHHQGPVDARRQSLAKARAGTSPTS